MARSFLSRKVPAGSPATGGERHTRHYVILFPVTIWIGETWPYIFWFQNKIYLWFADIVGMWDEPSECKRGILVYVWTAFCIIPVLDFLSEFSKNWCNPSSSSVGCSEMARVKCELVGSDQLHGPFFPVVWHGLASGCMSESFKQSLSSAGAIHEKAVLVQQGRCLTGTSMYLIKTETPEIYGWWVKYIVALLSHSLYFINWSVLFISKVKFWKRWRAVDVTIQELMNQTVLEGDELSQRSKFIPWGCYSICANKWRCRSLL